jgi:hypothetical protein
MPRKSKEDIRINRMIEELERLAFDTGQSSSARARYMGTLNSLNRQQSKAKAEKASRAAARAAARAEATRTYPTLPPRETAQEYEERVKRQLGH